MNTNTELREKRKQMFSQMEQHLQEIHTKEEDRLFYYHSSEDRVVLSHALFWTMTMPQYLKGKIRNEQFFILLRKYEEEMLDAYLQEDDYFSELLHYCNILYEMLPVVMMPSLIRTEKDARKLSAISIVAAGFGGDMDEKLADELLDDIDYKFNKVACRKIEQMMPTLRKMVENEMSEFRY
ncbi:MAG: hypothetical protein IJ584_17150 [Bacteroidales bacterium]|nr:hypothetical protein [Bacteroidales bacterium]